MPENPTINTQHPKGLLVTLLRLLCRRSIGEDESNNYLDVHLVCQDGVVGVSNSSYKKIRVSQKTLFLTKSSNHNHLITSAVE